MVRDGRYGWRFIFPVRITFQSETNVRTARYTADVVVVRESQKDNPKGIAISTSKAELKPIPKAKLKTTFRVITQTVLSL